MSSDWHSLGESNGDWFYMKVNDFEVEDGVSVCDFEIYKNDDDKPVLVVNQQLLGKSKELPDNIIKDIEEVIASLKEEHDSQFSEPDYEGYKQREAERQRDAQEAWLFRNSIK
jgi:hypothetical protein